MSELSRPDGTPLMYRINGKSPGKIYIGPQPSLKTLGFQGIHQQFKQENIQSVLCLQELDEPGCVAWLDALDEMEANVFHLPIPDYGTPLEHEHHLELLRHVLGTLHNGQNLLIHCKGGVGRSSTIAAFLLKHFDDDLQKIWADIARSRGYPVPETAAQKDWVHQTSRLQFS